MHMQCTWHAIHPVRPCKTVGCFQCTISKLVTCAFSTIPLFPSFLYTSLIYNNEAQAHVNQEVTSNYSLVPVASFDLCQTVYLSHMLRLVHINDMLTATWH